MAKKGFLEGYQTYDTSKGFGNSEGWRKAFQQRITNDKAQTVISSQPLTPHQILNVPPHATTAEIKKAYKALIKEWHPDRNPHRLEQAAEMSRNILAAYKLLNK